MKESRILCEAVSIVFSDILKTENLIYFVFDSL